MSNLLIIADDLTGAADCGIACVSHGLNTVVVMNDSTNEVDADVLSVDANTRHLNAKDAAAETTRLVQKYLGDNKHLLFKKLDSTLRGNVAAELAASLEARRSMTSNSDRAIAVLAPAFPANGRTTSSGRQLVHGKPLEETEMWQLHGTPASSHIPEILHTVGLRPALIPLDQIRSDNEALLRVMLRLSKDCDVLVCDAETDEDMSAIAHASMILGENTIWAGSAGLAYHLPRAAGFGRTPASLPFSFLDRSLASGPTLVVIGSLSSVSREQVTILAASSETVIFNITPDILLASESSPEWHEHTASLQRALNAGRDVAVCLGAEIRCDPNMGQMLSAALAQFVRPCADNVGALVATGGETARAVLDAWGIHRLRLAKELEAGLACSIAEGWGRHLPVLTKAGAFGTPQSLLHCQQFLRELNRDSATTFFQHRGQ